MARIRTIKPEFPQSESMGRVGREARLCFVLLWTIADDEGRLRGNSRMLASLLYPYDDDAGGLIDGWLAELESESCIVRYLVGGSTYLQITKWTDHQKIDKPSKSKIEPIGDDSRILAKGREESATDQRTKDQGSKDQGSRTKEARAPAARAAPDSVSVQVLLDAGFDQKTAEDFIAHKAKAKAPLTQRAWADHLSEAEKAGWTPAAAAEKVMAKSWKGFESKYVVGEPRPGGMAAPPAETAYQRSMRERMAGFAPGAVARAPGQAPAPAQLFTAAADGVLEIPQ